MCRIQQPHAHHPQDGLVKEVASGAAALQQLDRLHKAARGEVARLKAALAKADEADTCVCVCLCVARAGKG